MHKMMPGPARSHLRGAELFASRGHGKNLLANGCGIAAEIDCEEAVAVGADDRVLVYLLSDNGVKRLFAVSSGIGAGWV